MFRRIVNYLRGGNPDQRILIHTYHEVFKEYLTAYFPDIRRECYHILCKECFSARLNILPVGGWQCNYCGTSQRDPVVCYGPLYNKYLRDSGLASLRAGKDPSEALIDGYDAVDSFAGFRDYMAQFAQSTKEHLVDTDGYDQAKFMRCSGLYFFKK